ncbi:MAG: hypothetical protein Q8P63_00090 [Candidatus Nealsonbacteria bacterium]|nr:hypothetical protein [Candidatus Nealsonbacteria bacterium]
MPTKKVFDIIPPKEGKDVVFPVKIKNKPAFLEKLKIDSRTKPPILKSRVGFKDKKVLGSALVLFVFTLIALGAYFLIKPKAEVEIFPIKKPIEFKTQATVVSDGERSLGQILGKAVVNQQVFSQDFLSTGIQEKNVKAAGIIRVYNAYSTKEQPLVATTRFVSDDGKLFRTPKRVVIPGGHYEGSKLVPGEIDITVEAGEAGEEYNIGPSTFSIPGFAGNEKYTAFYAKSSSSMTGGAKTQVAEVIKEDLENAENTLSDIAIKEVSKVLENSLSQEKYIVVEGAIKAEVVGSSTLAEENQELSSFTFQIEARARAIVFKDEDLKAFAKNYILGLIEEGETLDENSLAVSYSVNDIDFENETMTLDLQISAETYRAVDENAVKISLKNKRSDELKASLEQFPDIERSQVRLWPFWVNRVPQDIERIELKLKLD